MGGVVCGAENSALAELRRMTGGREHVVNTAMSWLHAGVHRRSDLRWFDAVELLAAAELRHGDLTHRAGQVPEALTADAARVGQIGDSALTAGPRASPRSPDTGALYALPVTYMPWATRENGALNAARSHGERWAREMGFFDDGNGAQWSQRTYERSDFALFAGLTYPEAPGPRLDAITDFLVWLFFFDDLFFRRFDPGDLVEAKRYVARLPAFMPLDLDASHLEPANLVERSLLDVWLRIAEPMSARWRRRFARDIQEMNESFLWELGNAAWNVVPDLIEYVEMRRLTGGAFWAVDLVEFSRGIEVAARIYQTHPIRLLHNICGDTVLLFNDILSYEKELAEGERNNGVLVVQQFMGCDLQRAVEVVNDLVTARLKAAEHAMATEIDTLLDDHALDPGQRRDVLAYVQGLRDGVAGCCEWQARSGRYQREP